MIILVHAPLILTHVGLVMKNNYLHFSPQYEQVKLHSHFFLFAHHLTPLPYHLHGSNASLSSQILDDDPSLHFALLRLHLIELIRTCHQPGEDITPAIEFATTHLAPRAPTSPEFLEDLERTMSLLIFGPENLEPPLTRLLHPDLRREVADRVNKAILQKENQRRDAAIRNLVKMRVWGENVGREKGRDYPAEGEWEMGFDREPEAEVKDEEDENMIG